MASALAERLVGMNGTPAEPVIAFDCGRDVSVYCSVVDALRVLEFEDFNDPDVEIFDCEGWYLRASGSRRHVKLERDHLAIDRLLSYLRENLGVKDLDIDDSENGSAVDFIRQACSVLRHTAEYGPNSRLRARRPWQRGANPSKDG